MIVFLTVIGEQRLSEWTPINIGQLIETKEMKNRYER